jgi:D-glutamate cyclase
MSDPASQATVAALEAIRDIVQEDVGQRGLRTDPVDNLITRTSDDFIAACRSVAVHPAPALAIVTGFFIPHGQPPAAETDGPLGAVFVARGLVPLGIKVVLAADEFVVPALQAGLAQCGLRKVVPVVTLPSVEQAGELSVFDYWQVFTDRAGPITHLVALERAGPSHTPSSVRAQPESTDAIVEQFLAEAPAEHHERYHTMRGRDVTSTLSPAHRLFEIAARSTTEVTTIGIGDGGNEIGMGKIPWEVIRRNIPGGGMVACRVPADYLIVAGVSNWGAYGLTAGVRLLRGATADRDLFDLERERQLLQWMVERGPLVDGVTGQQSATVDGLDFDRYAEPLGQLGKLTSA